MPAVARAQKGRSWSSSTSHDRGGRTNRHAHAPQIAALEQRMRHKQSMVGWLNFITTMANFGAVLALIGCAAGGGALAMSLGAQESILSGVLVIALTFSLALCCILTRFLVCNARQALSREIQEAVKERNRLQYLR